MAGLGGAQLPFPPSPGPHSLAPKWEDGSCPLPPPHTPATCPVPEAKREEAASQRGRAHNFAASGRARAGVQGSSYPRPELGEFISPTFRGGAAAAAAAVARGAASRASGRRWPRSRRPPALPVSLGLRLCHPPPRARPAPALNGQLSAPAGRPGGLCGPSSRGRGCCCSPCAPHSPSPSLAFQAPRRIWRLLPRPPWRPAWGRHLLHRSPGLGLPGWVAPPQPPGAPGGGPVRSPQ